MNEQFDVPTPETNVEEWYDYYLDRYSNAGSILICDAWGVDVGEYYTVMDLLGTRMLRRVYRVSKTECITSSTLDELLEQYPDAKDSGVYDDF